LYCIVSIPQISTKQTPLSLTELTEHTKKPITYDVGNPGPGLGQAPKCSEVKLVNGIPTLLF
jgi:hypothetical protein